MNILVQGSKTFSDYSVFMRSMAVAMSDYKGDEVVIYCVGPLRVNEFTAQFSNLSEDGMSARGKTMKYFTRPFSWAKKNMNDMDYVIYLTNHKTERPQILKLSEAVGIEGGIFRYG